MIKEIVNGYYIDYCGNVSTPKMLIKKSGNKLYISVEDEIGFKYLNTIDVYGSARRAKDGSSTYRLTDGRTYEYVFPAGINPDILEKRLRMELEIKWVLRKPKYLSDTIIRQMAGLLYGRYKILPDAPDTLRADEYRLEEIVPCDEKRKTWLSEIRKVKDLSIYSNQTVAVLYDLPQH